jgi:hypothetical protein
MKRLSTLSALVGSLLMAGTLGVACSHQQHASSPPVTGTSSLLRPELGTSTAMGPSDPTRKPDVPVTKAPPIEPVPTLAHPPAGPAPGNGTPAPTAAEIPKPPSGSPTPPDTPNPLPAQPPATNEPLPQPAPVQPQPIAPPPPTTMPAPTTPPSMMPMQGADGGLTVPPAPGDAQVPPRPPTPRDAAAPPTPPTTPPRLPGGDGGIH